MKIGGVTWWRCNYGSVLQAYALQKQMEKYTSIDYEIINQYGRKATSIDNLVNKLIKTGIYNTFRRFFWRFLFSPMRVRNQKIQDFVDDRLVISEKCYDEDDYEILNEDYNGFICGSDQIWNPTITKFDSIYWLKKINNNMLKIAYAPSVGVNEFNHEQIQMLKDIFSSFDAISCRELSGTNAISSQCGCKCVKVLDPTLMVDCKIWDQLYLKRLVSQKYIFVYLLRGSKKQRKIIEEFAREKNLNIVTLPFLEAENIVLYDFFFGDIQYWECGPREFITLIKYADYIFTDSFHCTIFSVLNHKKYSIFPKIGNAQMTRIIDLQESLGLPSRIVDSLEDVYDCIDDEIEWTVIDKNIIEQRAESQKFLDDVFAIYD